MNTSWTKRAAIALALLFATAPAQAQDATAPAASPEDSSAPSASITPASSDDGAADDGAKASASTDAAPSADAANTEPPADASPTAAGDRSGPNAADGTAAKARTAKQLERENEVLRLKLELAQARIEVEQERAKRAGALLQVPTGRDVVAGSDEDNAERLPARFYNLNLGINALSRNISAGLTLKYLWAVQTNFTADILLTPLISGLGLDDLDSVRFTAGQTVGWRMSMFPFKFMPRNVQKPSGPWPDLIFGAGVWALLEADHLAQAFRLGDAGLFVAATTGPFIGVAFQDVNVGLSYRPFSIAAFFLDGKWDQRPVAFGNPILDVSVMWTLPL